VSFQKKIKIGFGDVFSPTLNVHNISEPAIILHKKVSRNLAILFISKERKIPNSQENANEFQLIYKNMFDCLHRRVRDLTFALHKLNGGGTPSYFR